MTTRRAARYVSMAVAVLMSGCATYTPPPPAASAEFSRDLHGSYDRTWSAVTYVAGANFFKIKAFEKASGLMTLDFDIRDPRPYVDCGTVTSKSTNEAVPAVKALGLRGLHLVGSSNINIRAEGAGRTALQFNSQYDLVGFTTDLEGHPVAQVDWHFTSGSSDSQRLTPSGPDITCRPSYKMEQSFLEDVSARL